MQPPNRGLLLHGFLLKRGELSHEVDVVQLLDKLGDLFRHSMIPTPPLLSDGRVQHPTGS
jgi:hypothetical protein